MTSPIDTDAVRVEIFRRGDLDDPRRDATARLALACADEIDRLRADVATATGACETWKADARRLAADVAAMLPIVEAAADAEWHPDAGGYVIASSARAAADTLLAARKATP